MSSTRCQKDFPGDAGRASSRRSGARWVSFPHNEVFIGAGVRVLKTPPRAPRVNANVERWIGGLRRQVLDRMLIVNTRHLRRVLAPYEAHFNQHRPRRSLAGCSVAILARLGRSRYRGHPPRSSRWADPRVCAGRVVWPSFWHPPATAGVCGLCRPRCGGGRR
ncbi:integrase core domain-containing protein [Nonomuraea dietziae]|uniref:integrase core domain-containing protein n=1 Tax=Nonomuraea dietziae TaxID=65515 RepID=UPI0033D6EE82